MIQGIPTPVEKFLADVARLQRRAERAQQQLSTGLKLTKVSDSPDQVGSLLQLRAEAGRAAQANQNLGRVKTEVDTAEKALQSALRIFDRARVLTTQGANGLASAETRLHLATELEGLLERMVALTAANVEGRYIFSGDTDQAAPYQLDPTTANGVGPYLGASSTRQISDSSGFLFSIGQSADILFDSANADENVFFAINGARRALLAVDNPPNPPDPTIPTLEEALRNLGTATVYLNRHLASYGVIQNRVGEAIETATKLELDLKRQISSIEEADLVDATTELVTSRTNLETALQARASTPRRSLFDYLG
jgi:flagellar hook-associated protein 3 FlgL